MNVIHLSVFEFYSFFSACWGFVYLFICFGPSAENPCPSLLTCSPISTMRHLMLYYAMLAKQFICSLLLKFPVFLLPPLPSSTIQSLVPSILPCALQCQHYIYKHACDIFYCNMTPARHCVVIVLYRLPAAIMFYCDKTTIARYCIVVVVVRCIAIVVMS